MTTKDYIKIVKVLNDLFYLKQIHKETMKDITFLFIKTFKEDNSKFDETKFKSSCDFYN